MAPASRSRVKAKQLQLTTAAEYKDAIDYSLNLERKDMTEKPADDALAVLMAGATRARQNQELVVQIAQRSQQASTEAALRAMRITPQTAAFGFSSEPPLVLTSTSLLLQTIVERGQRTPE